jgi:putative oxidoreductase
MKGMIAALGRMALSLIFILAACNKLLNWEGAHQSLVNAAMDLVGNLRDFPLAEKLMDDYFMPWSSKLLMIATAFELVGGLCLFLGIRVRLGAFLLLLLLAPATLLFHSFWWIQGAERELQMTMFLKNLSIFGALLFVLAHGRGEGKGQAGPKKASNAKKE